MSVAEERYQAVLAVISEGRTVKSCRPRCAPRHTYLNAVFDVSPVVRVVGR